MKRRVLSIVAIVVVAMTALVSCGPKDEVDLSIYESQTANTSHQVYNYAPDAPVSAFYSVKVAGDECYVKKENQSLWSFKVWECNNVKVDGLTVCNMYGWSCAFLEVNDLDINNFKVIAPYNEFNTVGVDNGGIDLLGCQRAKCINSFAYAHDDGILVKSHKWSYAAHAKDNLFENCIAWTVGGGNSFEVGYELDKGVEDITFRNIYALHSGTRGNAYRRGAVTIHNATAGVVQNIHYENVHIEDPKEYGIYVSLLKSEYGIGDGVEWGPGVIKNVTFKNVYFYKEPPRGHQINGLNNGDSRVQNLVFENLNICGKKITQPDEKFFIQLADVKFK